MAVLVLACLVEGCGGAAHAEPYLDRGRRHLASLVEIQGHNVGEPAGVGVHGRGAVAKSLQDGVDRLPLLSWVTTGTKRGISSADAGLLESNAKKTTE